jgi:Rrf2 family cysteine metabolism transcriptional repressor
MSVKPVLKPSVCSSKMAEELPVIVMGKHRGKSPFMKLSSRARYALRAMKVVALESRDGTPVRLGIVSERTAISKGYLEQVAISLKGGGLLKAVLGNKGGYLLTRPPEKITVGEIVEAAIGPINIVDCVANSESCERHDDCECRSIYVLINRQIRETFNMFTLAQLAQGEITEAIEHEVYRGATKSRTTE